MPNTETSFAADRLARLVSEGFLVFNVEDLLHERGIAVCYHSQ